MTEPSRSERLKKSAERGFPFVERSGLKLRSADRGRVSMTMPFDSNGNHVGTMYAGALFTLAEIPGGVLFSTAFDTKKYFPIIGEMTIRFVKPVTGAAHVEAVLSDEEIDRVTAELDATGRAKYILELQVTDDEGDVVAVTTGTYFARSF